MRWVYTSEKNRYKEGNQGRLNTCWTDGRRQCLCSLSITRSSNNNNRWMSHVRSPWPSHHRANVAHCCGNDLLCFQDVTSRTSTFCHNNNERVLPTKQYQFHSHEFPFGELSEYSLCIRIETRLLWIPHHLVQKGNSVSSRREALLPAAGPYEACITADVDQYSTALWKNRGVKFLPD